MLSTGNLAGESPEVRTRLQANGAVRPLLQLVLAATGQPGSRVLSTACTAAWALSNMLQDSSSVVSVSTEAEHTKLSLLRPLLRIAANVAALGGRDAAAELLVPPLCTEAVSMVHYCLTNRDAGLQAEAAWLCTNMAAMPDRPKGEEARSHRCQDALRQLVPVLEHITLCGDSLAQREAAHAMANLTAVGTS
ncbi:MAG: hypothetical protein FRX49_09748 [Trebouxia sp. A1-2]|nr:MAG: hypothetical protein FRX49_09748 [Trebouxia sp. A1-2]